MSHLTRNIAEIKPYWNNPRDNEAAVPAVAASLKEFGQLQPLVLDKEGVIIAGHTRYRAMLLLGWTEAWVEVAEHLSPEQARAFRVIDNKTGELASWDSGKLIVEVRAANLEVFHVHFPELEPIETPQVPAGEDPATYQGAVTQAQVETAQHNQSQRFSGPTAQARQIREITCPNCDHRFETN